MANNKRAYLNLHLRHVKHGHARTRTMDLNVSLDDNEINYYICRHKNLSAGKEDFDLFLEERQDLDTLAVLHTQQGFVCLEARTPNVSVPLLGLGFNGVSAHDFRVKASVSHNTRNLLQLRPGEAFYVENLALAVVPEEQNDHYIHLASIGIVPSYDQYSQHVSQNETPFSQSPVKLKRRRDAIFETPKRRTSASSPLVVATTPENVQRHTLYDQNQTLMEEPSRSLDRDGRKRRKLSPFPKPAPTSGTEYQSDVIPGRSKSVTLEDGVFAQARADTPTKDIEVLGRTRKQSPIAGRMPADESQDSLAGKVIKVVGHTAQTPKPMDSPIVHIATSGSRSKSKTPSVHPLTTLSPTNSVEPFSSTRSTRSGLRDESHLNTDRLRVLFSSATTVGESKAFKKFLKEQGVETVQNIKDASYLCVGNGELKKTTKFIMAVLKGIPIIRESWITDSARSKHLHDIDTYTAKDPQRERDWGINLEEAIERGKQGTKIFQGWTIIFSPSAKKDLGSNFSDFKEIAICAGAKKVTMTIPKKSPDQLPSTLLIGTTKDLTRPESKNWRCCTKDMISLSILRGILLPESDEFIVQNEAE